MTERLRHIDGHRGLAILAVIAFHAYTRWPDQMPYGHRLAEWPMFKYGWLGVELFFLISGFVILMTLQRCESIGSFLGRRWRRLFPAMAACSLLIMLTAPLIPERPFGPPMAEGLLPGLTFTEPMWWTRLLHHEPQPLEGTFWSLYVEFKFYVIAALIYFMAGPVRLIVALFGLFVLGEGVHLAMEAHPDVARLRFLDGVLRVHLSLLHFGWFASGAAFYRFVQTRDWRWFFAACGMGVCAAVFVKLGDTGATVAATLVTALFAATFVSQAMQRCLSWRPLVWVGFISYPLYLLHENALVGLTVQVGRVLPWLPPLLMPVLPLALIVAVAWPVAAWVEPWIGGWLRRITSGRRQQPSLS